MSYTHGKAIKEIVSPGGLRRVDIVARDDGQFQFFEEIAHSKEDGGGWLPGKVGGLYATAEAAEFAARAFFGLK